MYVATGAGIGLTQNSIITQDSGGVGSNAEPFDAFGAALAAGDFDADGFADLAVGVPNESVGSVDGAGAVNVLVGFEDGLIGRGGLLLAQNVGDVGSEPELFDSFGSALASGDFDGDGTADLAVGVPFESVGAVESAGVTHAFDGSSTGLQVTGTQMFVQGSGRVGSTPEFPDEFGEALGAADFDGDGHDDLAIGAPFESVGAIEQAGAIFVLDGTGSGLTGSGSQVLHQGVEGVGSDPEVFDGFGFSLATTTRSATGAPAAASATGASAASLRVR